MMNTKLIFLLMFFVLLLKDTSDSLFAQHLAMSTSYALKLLNLNQLKHPAVRGKQTNVWAGKRKQRSKNRCIASGDCSQRTIHHL